MPVTPTPAPCPPADPDLVGRIAEILLSADDDPGVAEAAWLVRVEPVAEPAADDADDHAGASTSSEAAVLSGLDLGLVALDAASGHPADLLRGFVAPPEWWAIGVIASGRAHAVPPDLVGPEPDAPGVAMGPASEPGPVRLVHLVTRNGHSALALRHRRTGAVTVHQSTDPVPGDLADVCRRTLGLATAPAEHPVGLFWDDWWLESLMQEAMLSPQGLTWTHAAALHPLADELPVGAEPRHIRRLVEHRAAGGWEALRTSAVEGNGAVLADGSCCSADLASWYDEGSFSRAVLGVLPRRDSVVDTLAALVSAPVLAAVRDALSHTST
jgi:hypothetical protein